MFDCDAKSDRYASKPHGRADFWVQLCRLALVLIMELQASVGAVPLLLVMWLCAVTAVYAYMSYQPYHNAIVNRALNAVSFIYCWACFCVTLLQIRNRPQVGGRV